MLVLSVFVDSLSQIRVLGKGGAFLLLHLYLSASLSLFFTRVNMHPCTPVAGAFVCEDDV